MIQFKLNGQPLSIPTRWDEFTTDQHLRILDLKEDNMEIVSILTSVDYETLKKSEVNGLEHLIIIASSLMHNPPAYTGSCDKVGPYTLPKNDKGQFNIQYEILAQFEDMREIMKTCVDDKTVLKAAPKFVAIYLQKIRDGEYSYSKAMDMVPEVLTYPAQEVLTTGLFFYAKQRILSAGILKTSPPTNQSQKKKKPVSKGSRKSSARRSR